MIAQSNLLIALVTSCLRVSWSKLTVGMENRLQRYDMILEHVTKKTHTQTPMHTYTHCPAPPHPQSTMAKPHVSVGINRSAQSCSHPALKSFLEVVLQKPAAEEDKRTAIPPGPAPPQLPLCCPPPSPPFLTYPYFPSIPYYLSPSFPQHLILSVTLLVPTFPLAFHSILLFMSTYRHPLPFCVHHFLEPLPPRCFLSASDLSNKQGLLLLP